MLKTLLPYAKKYKLFAILTPLCIVGEVLLETRIPVLMSNIVDIGIPNQNIQYVVVVGLSMMLMALCIWAIMRSVFSLKVPSPCSTFGPNNVQGSLA